MAEAKPSQAQLLDYIRATYPDVYGLLSVDAEVRKVILDAAEKHYDSAKLQGALAATRWWKRTAAQARQWDASYAQDRATGDQLLTQTRDEIAASAARLGVALSPKELSKYALNVRRNGWTQQAVMQGLASKFTLAAKPGAGTGTVDALRAQAAEYGIKLSDATLTNWTRRLIGGTADESGFRSYLVKQAQSLFPSIASDISDGQTVRDYFDPYVQSASRILGVNPNEVDLSDTKWRRALVQVDPATGKRVPMSLDQWEVELRSNSLYGFDRTANGRAAAAEFATQLRKAVGQ